MNKTELVKKVAAETEMTQKQAAAALESVLGAIQDAVAAGDHRRHRRCMPKISPLSSILSIILCRIFLFVTIILKKWH